MPVSKSIALLTSIKNAALGYAEIEGALSQMASLSVNHLCPLILSALAFAFTTFYRAQSIFHIRALSTVSNPIKHYCSRFDHIYGLFWKYGIFEAGTLIGKLGF